MKYIVETFDGVSYFVDTSKPLQMALRLFPEVDWQPSFYLKNNHFLIGQYNVIILNNTEMNTAIRARTAFVIWKGR